MFTTSATLDDIISAVHRVANIGNLDYYHAYPLAHDPRYNRRDVGTQMLGRTATRARLSDYTTPKWRVLEGLKDTWAMQRKTRCRNLGGDAAGMGGTLHQRTLVVAESLEHQRSQGRAALGVSPVMAWTAGTRSWGAGELRALRRVDLRRTRRVCHCRAQPNDNWVNDPRGTARTVPVWSRLRLSVGGDGGVMLPGICAGTARGG